MPHKVMNMTMEIRSTTSMLSFASTFDAPMHQPVVALEAPVVHPMSVSTNPVGTFDEIILKASEGDMLRSMDNADGFYTTDNHFEVIMGTLPYSNGYLTIMDDDGLEVPRLELLDGRIQLHTLFRLVPKVDERVEMLNNLRTKRDSMTANAQSIVDDIASLDEFDAEWNTPFGLMSDEDKGALLLASSEDKTIQGALPWEKTWHKTSFDKPVWNPNAYYRVKPLSYSLLDSILMDIKFEITELDASIYELQSDIDSDW